MRTNKLLLKIKLNPSFGCFVYRGMSSLLALLPFYDAGSGTFYDLRHFTMQTAPKVKDERKMIHDNEANEQ